MLHWGAGYDRRMGYKILGFVVWRAARWYTRRRVAAMVPSRRVLVAALVVSAVGAVAVATAQRDSDD